MKKDNEQGQLWHGGTAGNPPAHGRGVVIGADGPGVIATGRIEGSAVVLASGQSIPCNLQFPLRAPAAAEPSDLELLHWSCRLPRELIGRGSAMQALTQWAEQGPALSLAALRGDLGAGKTRLAFELADQLRQQGWQAGVVSDLAQPLAFAHSNAGCLLIVDDWQGKTAELEAWLRGLQGAEAAGLRVRVLLLARAFAHRDMARHLQAGWGAAGMVPLVLRPLHEDELWALFQASHTAYAARRNVEAPLAITRDGFAQWLRQHRSHPHPLPVQAYALHLVRTPQAQEWDADQVVADIVRRERVHSVARWQALGMADVAQGAWRMQVLAALTGSLSLVALGTLRQQLPVEAIGNCVLPTEAQWRRVLGDAGVLHPLEPDWIAAPALHMLEEAGDVLPGVCAPVLMAIGPAESDPAQALTQRLQRMLKFSWARFAWRANLLDAWARALIPMALRDEALWRQAFSGRDATGVRPLALALAEAQWARLKAAVDGGDLTQRPALAASLQALSALGSEQDDNPGCLQAAEQAAEIYAELARHDFAAHGVDLAASLSSLSKRRGNGGDHDGACVAIERAVKTCEKLARGDFVAHGPALAASLDEQLKVLSGSAPKKLRVKILRRLVEVREQLALGSLAVYGPDLADSLRTLAQEQAERHPEDAWQAGRRVLEIYTQLARDNFAAYGRQLADSLHSASFDLASSEGPYEQLRAIQEEVAVRERLAQSNLAVYGPALAKSLEFLAGRLEACDDPVGSLQAARRGVEICEPLTQADFSTHGALLAGSLANLARLLEEAGDVPGALAAVARACELTARLPPQPGAPAGNRLAWMQKRRDALSAALAAQA